MMPAERRDNLVSAFVQDDIRLTNSLSLILGSKFEHNSYTGFEYEPSAQLVWNLNDRQAVLGVRVTSDPATIAGGLQSGHLCR